MANNSIDITFNFTTDANGGDPDSTSPTLKRYHQLLWSKPLPNGKLFDLDRKSRKGYLYHKSELGEFVLTSDAVIQTFAQWIRYQHIREQLSDAEVSNFNNIGYTIGGMMVFPGNRVDGGMTINGARGFNQSIGDRFDLTLECIRRYYAGKESPLYSVLVRYDNFFRLFDDFRGYVEFFLLRDLTGEDYSAVRFFAPFDNFNSSPMPDNVEAYVSFREKTIEFVISRNNRIADLDL